MQHLSWKTQLAILWLIQTVNYVALILITQVETGIFGTVEPGSAADLIAIFFFIPCLMAWLAFSLPESISRWLHVVFGALFVVVKALAVVDGITTGGSFAYMLNEIWGLLAAGLIVWVGWRAPKSNT